MILLMKMTRLGILIHTKHNSAPAVCPHADGMVHTENVHEGRLDQCCQAPCKCPDLLDGQMTDNRALDVTGTRKGGQG